LRYLLDGAMATHVRHPVVPAPRVRPGAGTFSLLFFLESVARASMVTVLPLTALALFGDKGSVSLAYTGVSLAALGFSFAIPGLVRRLSRRWTYTLGCVLLGLYGILVALDVPPAVVAGMFCRTAGAAVLNITLSLYIMDAIAKRDLTRSEPQRMAAATLAWSAMPFLGVWLMQRHGLWAPAALATSAAALTAVVFWGLRLAEGGPIRPAAPGSAEPASPFGNVRRFAAQPRLRLAWTIAFARSSFWVTFFIYVPILMVEGGLGPTAGGLAVAAANLMLLTNLFARGWAERLSLRRVLGGAFLAAAVLTLAAGALSAGQTALAGAVLVAAAFFMAIADGLGPVPFLRAARARERPQMTTVYRTYLDASELLPPLAYFFLFKLAGFAGAFAGLALLLAATGALTLRHLPRGM
jgi:MFS family permease